MKKDRVTITDIARELNIAPSTVSRALKDHPSLKEGNEGGCPSAGRKIRLSAQSSSFESFAKKNQIPLG